MWRGSYYEENFIIAILLSSIFVFVLARRAIRLSRLPKAACDAECVSAGYEPVFLRMG